MLEMTTRGRLFIRQVTFMFVLVRPELPLRRNQFQRGRFTTGGLEALDEFSVGLGGVLLGEGVVGSVVEALTAQWNGANRDLTVCKSHVAKRLGEEGAIPAGRLIIPGAYDHPAFDNHHPDADEAMVAGADVEILCGCEGGDG